MSIINAKLSSPGGLRSKFPFEGQTPLNAHGKQMGLAQGDWCVFNSSRQALAILMIMYTKSYLYLTLPGLSHSNVIDQAISSRSVQNGNDRSHPA